MTLNHLMVMFQSWIIGECEIPLHCLYFLVHSVSEWYYLKGSHLRVKYNNDGLFNCVQTNDWCWIRLLVLHNNTWNPLIVCKRFTRTLRHSLERAASLIGFHTNAHKTEYMCYNQTGDISTQDGTSLKLVDKFTYLGSSVSSTEKDIG